MKKRNIKAENERSEKGFPKNPDNITKNQLHKHFDSDNDGKVTLDEYKEHIDFHCKNPDVLEEKLEQQDYERGFKYSKGGKTGLEKQSGQFMFNPDHPMADKLEKLNFERVLKDSGFNHIKGTPTNELTHNRGDRIAVIGNNEVHISRYTPNTKRFLSSTSFDNPKTLTEYLDENQIYAKGGKTKKSKPAPRKPISIKRGRDRSSSLRRMYGFAKGGVIKKKKFIKLYMDAYNNPSQYEQSKWLSNPTPEVEAIKEENAEYHEAIFEGLRQAQIDKRRDMYVYMRDIPKKIEYAKGGQTEYPWGTFDNTVEVSGTYWDGQISANNSTLRRMAQVENKSFDELREGWRGDISDKELYEEMEKLREHKAELQAENLHLYDNFGGEKEYLKWKKEQKESQELPFAKGGFLHRAEEKASWYWDTQMDRGARADFLEEIGDKSLFVDKYDDLPTKVQKEIVRRFQFAKGGKVKKGNNEMIMGGLAGVLLGIFFNK